jgi:hypothetical protein
MQQWWWSPVMEVAVVGDVEGMKKSNKEEKKSYADLGVSFGRIRAVNCKTDKNRGLLI